MRYLVLTLAMTILTASALAADAPPTLVKKAAESFDEAAWPAEAYNKAGGGTKLSAEVAPDAGGGKCLEAEVKFSGKGFEWWGCAAAQPLVIPGDTKSVTFRYRAEDKRFPIIIHFRDGWGRTQVGATKLEWAPKVEAEGKWAVATFKIPDTWVRPITIPSIGTHNWESQAEAKTVHFWVDNLEVETDLADVDPATGALKTWTTHLVLRHWFVRKRIC